MKNLNLATYEVEEMSEMQMNEVNGGWIATAIAIAGACIYLYNNWDDFAEGFAEGWERN